MSEMVTITKEEYVGLVEAAVWTTALDTAGVSNWVGYSEAENIFKEMMEEENNG